MAAYKKQQIFESMVQEYQSSDVHNFDEMKKGQLCVVLGYRVLNNQYKGISYAVQYVPLEKGVVPQDVREVWAPSVLKDKLVQCGAFEKVQGNNNFEIEPGKMCIIAAEGDKKTSGSGNRYYGVQFVCSDLRVKKKFTRV